MKYEDDPAHRSSEDPSSGKVPEKADELLEAARKRGKGLLQRQKHAAMEELSSVAEVMKDAARRLEEKEEPGVGSYVQKAADQLERISASLKDRDLEDLLHQGERALRQRPVVFLGVTAAVGFAIGRFLRAGSQKIVRDVREKRSEGGNGSNLGP